MMTIVVLRRAYTFLHVYQDVLLVLESVLFSKKNENYGEKLKHAMPNTTNTHTQTHGD